MAAPDPAAAATPTPLTGVVTRRTHSRNADTAPVTHGNVQQNPLIELTSFTNWIAAPGADAATDPSRPHDDALNAVHAFQFQPPNQQRGAPSKNDSAPAYKRPSFNGGTPAHHPPFPSPNRRAFEPGRKAAPHQQQAATVQKPDVTSPRMAGSARTPSLGTALAGIHASPISSVGDAQSKQTNTRGRDTTPSPVSAMMRLFKSLDTDAALPCAPGQAHP